MSCLFFGETQQFFSMSGPAGGPLSLAVGEKVANFQVKKKLGEGACGQVYLVNCLKDGKIIGRAAMKVEPRMKKKDDEILRMEIFVMNRVKSQHVPTVFGHGVNNSFIYR